MIVGQVGISGSTTVGDFVTMGGQVGTVGHIEIGDFSIIAARAGVTKSLPGGDFYAGFPLPKILLGAFGIATKIGFGGLGKLRFVVQLLSQATAEYTIKTMDLEIPDFNGRAQRLSTRRAV